MEAPRVPNKSRARAHSCTSMGTDGEASGQEAAAGPSSSAVGAARSVEWCIEALSSTNEAHTVEALALLGEALSVSGDLLVDQRQIRRLARVLRKSGCVDRLCRTLLQHVSPGVHTGALLVLGNLASEDLDQDSALVVKAMVRASGA